MKSLEDYVTTIPDFPKPGIMFRDITTIMSDPDGFKLAIDGMMDRLEGVDFDLVLGSESRGFIFGTPVAYLANKGFIMVRKKGKLPRETISEDYDLEYGSATLEMHKDSIKPGQKVVIVDDLIATGGTTEAIVKMVERLGGEVVKILFVMELAGLKGRERLKDYDVESLLVYEGARCRYPAARSRTASSPTATAPRGGTSGTGCRLCPSRSRSGMRPRGPSPSPSSSTITTQSPCAGSTGSTGWYATSRGRPSPRASPGSPRTSPRDATAGTASPTS
jgi:adenine phosphoribosyltransferase